MPSGGWHARIVFAVAWTLQKSHGIASFGGSLAEMFHFHFYLPLWGSLAQHVLLKNSLRTKIVKFLNVSHTQRVPEASYKRMHCSRTWEGSVSPANYCYEDGWLMTLWLLGKNAGRRSYPMHKNWHFAGEYEIHSCQKLRLVEVSRMQCLSLSGGLLFGKTSLSIGGRTTRWNAHEIQNGRLSKQFLIFC